LGIRGWQNLGLRLRHRLSHIGLQLLVRGRRMLLLLNRVFPRGGLLLHLMVQSRLLLVLQLIRMRTIYRLRTRLINVDSFFGNMLVVRWGDMFSLVLLRGGREMLLPLLSKWGRRWCDLPGYRLLRRLSLVRLLLLLLLLQRRRWRRLLLFLWRWWMMALWLLVVVLLRLLVWEEMRWWPLRCLFLLVCRR